MVMMDGNGCNQAIIAIPVSDMDLRCLNQSHIAPRGQSWSLNPAGYSLSLCSQLTSHVDYDKCLLSVPATCQAWLHYLCVESN